MEIWKSIKRFEGYEVSNQGRVRSIPRIVTDKNGIEYFHKGKILSQYKSKKGYCKVQVAKHNESVHRLVAETFIPNPNNKPQVNHINGDKNCNYVWNLEWVTLQENIQHSIENNLHSITGLTKHNESRKRKVGQYDLNNNFIAEYESASEAGRILNTSRGNIQQVCDGKRKKCKGYKWKYLD